jgi:hypothetical protein
MTRLFTGPDNLTHSEEVPMDFPGGVLKLLPITSGELHLAARGMLSIGIALRAAST